MAKKKKEPKTGIAKHINLFPKSALEKMTVKELESKKNYIDSLIETVQEKWNSEIDRATKNALDIQSANDIINDVLGRGKDTVSDDEMDSLVKQRTELEQKLTGSKYDMNAIAYKNTNKIEYLESQKKSILAVLSMKKDEDLKDAEKKVKKKKESK